MALFKKKQKIDFNNLPKHIGFIMDGNGRWAKKRGLPRSAGHKVGADALKKVCDACKEFGIKCISVYTLSIENFSRSDDEINYIFNIVKEYITRYLNDAIKNDTRIMVMGDLYHPRVPADVREVFENAIEKTKNNKTFTLNFAFAYTGRDEIVRAVKRIQADGVKEITTETISNYLDTAGLPDPDLVVRASGENRVSGFMLYQLAYSEFYFPKTLWPDFDKKEVENCIIEFQKRNRRFGNAK